MCKDGPEKFAVRALEKPVPVLIIYTFLCSVDKDLRHSAPCPTTAVQKESKNRYCLTLKIFGKVQNILVFL